MEDIISSQLIKHTAYGKGLEISDTEAIEILFQIETELYKFLIEKQLMTRNALTLEYSDSSIKELVDSISKDSVYNRNIDKFIRDRIGGCKTVNLNGQLPALIASILYDAISVKKGKI
ncbi:hypothetical protein KAX02_07355 [candidate division WOR-3 bacterium]|nr:hypothetical protein [candidate division WOR-3 bacterium]